MSIATDYVLQLKISPPRPPPPDARRIFERRFTILGVWYSNKVALFKRLRTCVTVNKQAGRQRRETVSL